MKIRTKLMIFFSVIYILIILAFGRIFYLNLIKIFTGSLEGKIGQMMDSIEKELNKHGISNKEELMELLNRGTQGEFAFRKDAGDYFWVGFYTKELEYLTSTNLARKFPLDLKTIDMKKKVQIVTFENVPNNHALFHSDSEGRVYALVNKKLIRAGGFHFYLVVLLPVTSERHGLKRLGKTTLLSFATLLIIVIISGLLFIAYTLKPIKNIVANLGSISKDDLSQRLKVHNKNDEIGELTLSINNLFERLEMSFEHERQFITDLSHEFKTPLSILRLTIENILNSPTLGDNEAEKLGPTLETLYSMDFLVQKLLYLSRLEQDKCPFNPQKTDLCKTLDKVFENLGLLAESKGLEFRKHYKEKELFLEGDPALLYMAFYNIVENALKYTDRGSVLILAGIKKHCLEITIEDTGMGISPEKLPLIFDKFYREDSSRSEKKGYGIGLSIVKRIIYLHKGKIDAESIPGVKTKFNIILPLCR